ncbi:MAG: hypothetical protein AB7E79_06925 [Rhodospirillaceae bacterium]
MSVSSDAAQVQEVANLRLPVPFFDLLMVLLVTCLVFVAPLPPEQTETMQAMDISIAQGKAKTVAPSDVIAVVPQETAGGWRFQVQGEGGTVAAEALAARASAEGRKVVLIVPPATSLQDFVTMQTALSAMKVPFALAIKNNKE